MSGKALFGAPRAKREEQPCLCHSREGGNPSVLVGRNPCGFDSGQGSYSKLWATRAPELQGARSAKNSLACVIPAKAVIHPFLCVWAADALACPMTHHRGADRGGAAAHT